MSDRLSDKLPPGYVFEPAERSGSPTEPRCTATAGRCEKPEGHDGDHYTEYRDGVWSARASSPQPDPREAMLNAYELLTRQHGGRHPDPLVRQAISVLERDAMIADHLASPQPRGAAAERDRLEAALRGLVEALDYPYQPHDNAEAMVALHQARAALGEQEPPDA